MNDLKHYKEIFDKYTKRYDEYGDYVKMKTYHMLKVADNMNKLAIYMDLDERLKKLSYIIGLFHDIGRYEQIKRFNTFRDEKSVDHADFSVQMIEAEQLLSDLSPIDYKLVLTAIKNHNKYKIEDGLDDEAILLCKMIRDADKIDIFRVVCEEPFEVTFNVSKDGLESSDISDKIYESAIKHELCSIKDRKQQLDFIIGCMLFIYDINFDESLKIIKEDNYYLCRLDTLDIRNDNIKSKLNKIFDEINTYIDSRLE